MTEKDKEIQELRIEVDRLKAELKKARQKDEKVNADILKVMGVTNWTSRFETPEDEIAWLRACLSLIADITARAAE